MERVAFEIAGHPIYWYGVMFVLGILAGVWTGSLRARLTTVTPKEFMDSIPWIVVGALVGARALFVITYWDEYFAGQPLWEIFAIQRGGLIYFGGLLFSIVTTAFYLVKNKIPVWIFLDILGPSLAVGHALGRLGCFINGCCYGCPTGSGYGFSYPDWHETHGVRIHPVQLYEMGLNLILFGLLEYFFRRRKYDGQITAYYLVGYGVIRFATEFFRGDVPRIFLSLTQAQCIAGVIFAAGVGLWIYRRRTRKAPSTPSQNGK
ncbi:MAG: prolipoprotein diacylglyceryl transferase [Verrucomicrobia bacterium]|nr:prolipoprotein diacylglyceryl transferase [Verrucomicrobiota bacterium]